MNTTQTLDHYTLLRRAHQYPLEKRLEYFSRMMSGVEHTYMRRIISPPGREVLVKDDIDGGTRRMLMFASNNYLGLADHPHVNARVAKAIAEYGSGIGGPPLLNGYIGIIRETEERLAALKGDEDCMILSSGFMTNLAIVSGLTQRCDLILFDELSHASFLEGTKMTHARSMTFPHNDLAALEGMLAESAPGITGSIFVCVEGVYSMDGNIAPLDRMAELCRRYGAWLVVDDAHGTGVLGKGGSGTASHLNCVDGVDVSMGTFSKVFATCGGFITGSKDLISYLRFCARPYIFSASVPPPVVATVLGGLDVMRDEPWLQDRLHDNMRHAIDKLRPFGFCAEPEAAIIALKLPEGMDIRKAAMAFHRKNIFINPVEYPAVPLDKQRFRISLMATHTKEDIDRLVQAVEEVWQDENLIS